MRIQQKYASASHRNPRPHKWHARKRLEQRLLGVADLHDQDAVILEVGSRAGKNGPNRVQAVRARRQADLGEEIAIRALWTVALAARGPLADR